MARTDFQYYYVLMEPNGNFMQSYDNNGVPQFTNMLSHAKKYHDKRQAVHAVNVCSTNGATRDWIKKIMVTYSVMKDQQGV